MDRWEQSEERILAENKAYFEEQAALADERGDTEAANAYRESAERTASFMDNPDGTRNDSAENADGAAPDRPAEPVADTPMDRWEQSEERILAENKAYFEEQAALADERGDTEAANAYRESAERTASFMDNPDGTRNDSAENADGAAPDRPAEPVADTPMDRWEQSEERILAENKAYFEEQAALADERGDSEAANAYRESAERTASFMDNPDGTRNDSAENADGSDQVQNDGAPSADGSPPDREVTTSEPDASGDELSPEDLSAIADYTGDGYSEINGALRGDDIDARMAVEERAQALSDALQKLPVHEGFVFRGLQNDLTPEQVARYAPGTMVTERAFTSASTSSDEMFQGGNVGFAIESATGRDVSEVSEYGNEREVLFDKDTSFRVESAQYDDKLGMYVIVMSEVPNGRRTGA